MDSCELTRVSKGAVGVAFLIDERKGASRVRAQSPEEAGPQKEHLVAGYGGDVADEAGEVTDRPYILQNRLVCGKEVGLDPEGVRNSEGVLNRVFYKDHPAVGRMRRVVLKAERCLNVAVLEGRARGPKSKDVMDVDNKGRH